jgi:solute carrier family 25 (mitochondrial phosphate transporter), member 3
MATLVGYSCQGACKFGFYEFFKKCYSDISGPENAERLRTLIYLAASASAEVIADVALCPMEAVKIRVQTQPGFARCLVDGLPKIVQSEGAFGYRYCMSCMICVIVQGFWGATIF